MPNHRFKMLILIWCACAAHCAEPIAGDEIRALIDELPRVGVSGTGYSTTVTSWGFLPYGESQVSMMLLQRERREDAPALRALVAAGAAAIPVLVASLADDRPIAVPPMSGMMWTGYRDEYDYNRRTAASAPVGVNLDYADQKTAQAEHGPHQLTVGDLCFLALGQIVNRRFIPARYQPSGGIVINSTSGSATLRAVATAEWGGVDRDAHRQRLIQDVFEPDGVWRRIDAVTRIACYYPAALPILVIGHLRTPTYDSTAIWDFMRGRLYAADAPRRKALIDAFLTERGEPYRDALIAYLFAELQSLEATEQHRMHPPFEHGAIPRRILVDDFGFSAGITYAQRPMAYPESSSERAGFLMSLVHDRDEAITQEVLAILHRDVPDDRLAIAAFHRLIGVGRADDIVDYCRKRAPSAGANAPAFEKIAKAIETARAEGKPMERGLLTDR